MSRTWTIKSMLDWISGYLEQKGDDNPLVSAQAMVSHVTGLQKIQLYMNHDKLLNDEQLDLLRGMVKRRAAGEPLQYILGKAPFRYLDIKVRPGVLIPRPETEVLVSELLSQLPSVEKRFATDSLLNEYEGAAALEAMREEAAALDSIKPQQDTESEFEEDEEEPTGSVETFGVISEKNVEEEQSCSNDNPAKHLLVADLCTGTGCIACALATEREDVRVIATDLSPDAIALAKENVVECGVENCIGVLCGDLGAPIEEKRPQFMGSFDAVISNPPYVPSAVLADLPNEVAEFEPALALDGGTDGLDIYRRILDWSKKALHDGGVLAVELHETCLEQAAKEAQEAGFKKVRIANDLAAKPRVLTAIW